MKLLSLGDVVGANAIAYLAERLPAQKKALGADMVIANGENLCEIKGISPASAAALFAAGVDFITTGNHVFDRRDAYDLLETDPRVIRPLNYPAECPGEGARVIVTPEGYRMLVLNVSGCAFMENLADPFRAVEYALESARRTYDFAVLDVHAEATSEKMALARAFDGRLAAVWGTHTHVQTADARVLPNGTGYITDLGMVGPEDSILGVEPAAIIARMRTHLPQRFTVAGGAIRATGALFEIDPTVGKTRAVRAVSF